MNIGKPIKERLNEKMEGKKKGYREHNKILREEIRKIRVVSKTKIEEYKAYVGQEYIDIVDNNVEERINKFEDMIKDNNNKIEMVEEEFKEKFKKKLIERDMNRLFS